MFRWCMWRISSECGDVLVMQHVDLLLVQEHVVAMVHHYLVLCMDLVGRDLQVSHLLAKNLLENPKPFTSRVIRQPGCTTLALRRSGKFRIGLVLSAAGTNTRMYEPDRKA